MNTISNHNILGLQSKKRAIIFIIIVLFIISLPAFYRLTYFHRLSSDFIAHLKLLIKGVHKGVWPPHFLYHILIYVVSLGSVNINVLKFVSVIVSAWLVIIKALMTFFVLEKEIKNLKIVTAVSLALVLVSPIVNWWKIKFICLGQISPNVWHNPTVILSAPLSFFLFIIAVKSLDGFRLKDAVLVSALLVLNALAKPNYVMSFITVFGIVYLFALWNKNFTILRLLFTMFLLFAPVLCVLAAQFRCFEGAGLLFAPFFVWGSYSPHIMASLVLSIAFPLSVTLLYFKELKEDKKIVYSWLILFVSLMQFVCLAEKGERLYHANFVWGCYISLFILFVMCCSRFFKKFVGPVRMDWKMITVLSFFTLHLLSGIYYYIGIILDLRFC